MATLEELRKWARGRNVEGMPKRIRRRKRAIVPPNLGTRDFKINVDGDDAILFFGEMRGQTISNLATKKRGRGYLRWIIKTDDFAKELKEVCRYQLGNQKVKRRG